MPEQVIKPTVTLVKMETNVEYEPFGAKDKVKLSVSIVQNLIAVKTKSGRTCSDKDAIKFLAMCQAKRINPFEGDCFLIGYDNRDKPDEPNFSLVTAHQTYLKRAELHQEFNGMDSGIIVREKTGALRDLKGDFYEDDQTVVGGWATVFFKTREHPMHKRLRLARFKKSFGMWLDDAAGMICKCAEADALRSSFPTMLGGLYMREELENPAPETKVQTPLFNVKPDPTSGLIPPPTPPSEDEERGKLERSIEEKSEKSKVGWTALCTFLSEQGILPPDTTDIREFPMNVLRELDAQWDEMVSRVK